MSHSHPPDAVVETLVGNGFHIWGHIDLCTICNEIVGEYRPVCQHRALVITEPNEEQRSRKIVEVQTCTDCGIVHEQIEF